MRMISRLTIAGALAGTALLVALPVAAGNPEPTYSGTVVGFCQNDPVIEVTNTGTGDAGFVTGGTGFPLPTSSPVITVVWPTDGTNPLAQAAWELREENAAGPVFDSGTLLLSEVCPTPPTDPPATDPPATDPPATDPPATTVAGGSGTTTPSGSGAALPATGPSNWWMVVAAIAFLLIGSALVSVRRSPS